MTEWCKFALEPDPWQRTPENVLTKESGKRCRDWVSLEADKKSRLRVPGPFRQEKEGIRKYLYPYKRRTTADMIVETVSAVVMYFRLFHASGMSVFR